MGSNKLLSKEIHGIAYISFPFPDAILPPMSTNFSLAFVFPFGETNSSGCG